MRVSVVGSGLIGQAWAIVFARGGCDVQMWDGHPDALHEGLSMVRQQIGALQSRGLLIDGDQVTRRIKITHSLEDALAGVDHVQENLPERVDIKREIFARLDVLCPADVVLASSTSSIPASSFTQALAGRQRCLVAHPVNPPYLIPVVEICPAPWTDDLVAQRTRTLMTQVGQKPVLVNEEVEGFVLNRLQGALLREAFRLVERGVISVEDLDVTVKDGLGLRWSFMGPFETIDLNAPGGLKDYCERYGPMYQRMSLEQTSTQPWSEPLVQNLDQARRSILPASALAERRTWRDERLMALMAHKAGANEE